MSNVNLGGGIVVAFLDSGLFPGGLTPASCAACDRPVFKRRRDCTLNLCGRCFRGERTALHSGVRVRFDHATRRFGRFLIGRPGPLEQSGISQEDPTDDEITRLWIRGILPADVNQRAVMTFDSWHSPRMCLEVVTDDAGDLLTAHQRVVREAMRIIDSGDTLVVQVCSTSAEDESPYASNATTRVWVFDRDGARAVDAEILQENLSPEERRDRLRWGGQFATGWSLTGEPGGGVPARRSAKKGYTDV